MRTAHLPAALLLVCAPSVLFAACGSSDDAAGSSDGAGGAQAGAGGTSSTGGSSSTGGASAGHAGAAGKGTGAAGHGGSGAAGGGSSGAGGQGAAGHPAGAGGNGPGTGGNGPGAGGNGPGAGGSSPGAGGNAGDTGNGGDTGAGGMSTGGSQGTGGGSGQGASCSPTISAEDTSNPTTVVSTCDEATLDAAIKKGGVITFACGTKTIALTSEHEIPKDKDKDITIDGGGTITLDGGGATRLFHFDGGDYRKTKTKVTFQHITLTGGHATGTMKFAPQPAPCSQGFKDGGGGAILFRDGVLHLVDVTVHDNHGETQGPDVAGGGVWAQGAIDITVVGSHFDGNSAANGGALGMLNSDLAVFDTTFTNNSGKGSGANSVDAGKCPNGEGNEIGDGGNGGAISIDGGSDGTVTMCGVTFSGNSSGALGGAIFRTPDGPKQQTILDQSTFDGNTAVQGGGAFYFHNSALTITASTISNNSAPGCGALQSDGSDLDFTNVTITGNSATKSIGGAICLFGNGGSLKSCTFANNSADMGFAADLFGGTKLTIDNTIFSDAMTNDEYNPLSCQATNDGGHDLQWPMVHGKDSKPDNPCVTGVTFADAMLGALADNGGPTRTKLPAPGGPAYGAGKSCPPTDQRGKPRPTDGCTIGAVE